MKPDDSEVGKTDVTPTGDLFTFQGVYTFPKADAEPQYVFSVTMTFTTNTNADSIPHFLGEYPSTQD